MAKIAIIEDNTDARELFVFMLESGYEILGFANGEEFLRQFYPGLFALVIVDLVLPDMDGFQLYKKMQQRGDNTTPVVALTAKAYAADKERALREGFCDYFVKPILELDEFKQRIFKHVGRCDTSASTLHNRSA